MKTGELREKSVDELDQLVAELQREQFNLRMQKGSNQLSNSAQVVKVRRDIARIKTIIGEKQKVSV